MSFKHTARYVVVLKSGHPAADGYHTSFTLALKHRRRLGRGARIIDRYDTGSAPKPAKRRRSAPKRTRRSKARCVCPPGSKRGRKRSRRKK